MYALASLSPMATRDLASMRRGVAPAPRTPGALCLPLARDGRSGAGRGTAPLVVSPTLLSGEHTHPERFSECPTGPRRASASGHGPRLECCAAVFPSLPSPVHLSSPLVRTSSGHEKYCMAYEEPTLLRHGPRVPARQGADLDLGYRWYGLGLARERVTETAMASEAKDTAVVDGRGR